MASITISGTNEDQQERCESVLIQTLLTDDIDGAGDVDLVVGGVGSFCAAITLPSGPFTDTLGISAFGAGVAVVGAPVAALCCCCFRAPGGM